MRASSGNNRTLLSAGLTLLVAGLSSCDVGGPAASPHGGTQGTSAASTLASTSAPASPSAQSAASAVVLSRPSEHGFRAIPTSPNAQVAGARSLRAAYIESVQSEADVSHVARAAGEDRFHFDNATQKLTADIAADGVHVLSPVGDAVAATTFHLTHYGCASAPGEKLAAVHPSQSRDRATRVTYARSRLVEWYQNGRLGFEQGFDLKEAPPCRAAQSSDPVSLTVEISHAAGLRPLLMRGQDGAEWLELRDAKNQIALRYSDLYAADADGKELPAHLTLDGDLLSLRIDDRGARYPLRVDPLIWAQFGSLYKAADADTGDHFGSAIAISGDTAVVGAPRDDQGATDAGAAYIFQLSSQGSWVQQAKIVATVPVTGGFTGSAVAITDIGSGSKRLVIGAPGDTAVSGVAVWFVGHGATWTPEAEFSSTNGFGSAVAVSADRVVVGSPNEAGLDGAVIIYEPDLALTPPWRDRSFVSGTTGSAEQLGSSVAISGSAIAIGAPSSDVSATDAGRIEIWERDPATAAWVRTGALQHNDPAAGDRLGAAVAIGLRSAVAGAPGKNSGAGAAYAFSNVFGVWSQEAKLVSSTGSSGEGFGSSIALAAERAVIGVPLRSVSGQNEAGAIETFTRTGSTWSFEAQVTARTALATDRLGSGLAWDSASGHILAGAPLNDTTTVDSGGFYDLIQLKQTGDSCAAGLECATGFCVDTVCCETACGGGSDADCQACATAKTGLADGLCRPASSAVVCRPAAGACDQVETCDGTNLACPNDLLLATTVTCRGSVGLCDLPELCTGTSPDCPADGVSARNSVCRPAAGGCDIAELCDGQTKVCPADSLKPALSPCRVTANECDAVEICDGQAAACPTDAKNPDNAVCSVGSCQAGVCRTEADVAVAIGGFAASSPQQPLPFTVSVSNSGRSPASAVTVEVTLPAGSSAGNSGGTGFTCSTQDLTVRCTRPTLSPGEIAQVSLLLNPPGQAESFNVTAKVSATEFDPNMANNTASFDQGVLSTQVSGSGFGCAAASGPGGNSSGGVALLGGALALLFLTTMRRRRAS